MSKSVTELTEVLAAAAADLIYIVTNVSTTPEQHKISVGNFGSGFVSGTANQITATPSGGGVVLSLPATLIAPGTIQGSVLTATTALVLGSSSDAILWRDGAGIIAQRNGLNAQEFRVFGTTVGTTYLSLSHGGTNAAINAASGSLFLLAGGLGWLVNTSGVLLPAVDNAYALGDPSYRVSHIYSVGATISTILTVNGPTYHTVTDTTTGSLNSISNYLYSSNTSGTRPVAAASANYAIHGTAGTVSALYGLYGYAGQSAGTVTAAIGVGAHVLISGGTSVSYVHAVDATVILSNGAGTLIAALRSTGVQISGGAHTTAIGVSVASNTKSGGTLTYNYGIKIDGQAIVGVTNYALYTDAGAVRFGDVTTVAYTPGTYAFQVVDASASGDTFRIKTGAAAAGVTIESVLVGLGAISPINFSASSLLPVTDNVSFLGSATKRWANVFGTLATFGTIPSTTGLIRVGNNGGLVSRNFGDSADISLLLLNTSNVVTIGNTSASGIRLDATGTIVVNESGNDSDFRIEAVNVSNHFVSDAGVHIGKGAFGFGAAPGNGIYIYEQAPTITATSPSYFQRHGIWSSFAATIAGGSLSHAVTLFLEEPNLSLVSAATVSLAATLYILGAPTEGTVNAALYVSSGTSYFGGNVLALTDNTYTSGGASNRWSNVYATVASLGTTPASTGTIRVPTAVLVPTVATPTSEDWHGVTKALADNTTTALFTVANASDGTMSGGIIFYTVTVETGSNIQVESGIATWCAINNGGTQYADIAATAAAGTVSSGTLTVTFSSANAGGGQEFRVNVDSSLNFDSVITYRIVNNSARAIALN